MTAYRFPVRFSGSFGPGGRPGVALPLGAGSTFTRVPPTGERSQQTRKAKPMTDDDRQIDRLEQRTEPDPTETTALAGLLRDRGHGDVADMLSAKAAPKESSPGEQFIGQLKAANDEKWTSTRGLLDD